MLHSCIPSHLRAMQVSMVVRDKEKVENRGDRKAGEGKGFLSFCFAESMSLGTQRPRQLFRRLSGERILGEGCYEEGGAHDVAMPNLWDGGVLSRRWGPLRTTICITKKQPGKPKRL